MSIASDAKGQRQVVSRRDFLRVGGLSVVGLSVAEQTALARSRESAERRSCIFILMTGGPSQFETFDPKPDAPPEIRGPLRAIQTSLPGVCFSEGLPKLAERADKLAVLRSLYHQAAPIHETGLQLLQTGRLARHGRKHPSFGSVAAKLLGPRNDAPANVVLPRLVQNTGVNMYCGQDAGYLGDRYRPLMIQAGDERLRETGAADSHESIPELDFANQSESVRRAYGDNRFGRLCWQARQLVQLGVRSVTVNLFDSLVNQITWDCHANGPGAPGTLYDYRDLLCPQFDRAVAALLDDLEQQSLLNDTLVVATGEFGRTPRLNASGGRDHWSNVWSGIVAGGGVQGGQVIGSSDALGAAPKDRPIELPELTASIYRGLGLGPDTIVTTDDGTDLPLTDHAAISELGI